jgi:WD40 repeat protein
MGTISNGAARACGPMARALAACLCVLGLALAAPAAPAQGRPAVLWSEAGHSGTITGVDLSPDGTLLATASADRTLKLWGYPAGTLLRTIVLPYDIDAQVTDFGMVRFTPAGDVVAAAVNQYDADQQSDFGTVHLFRVSDGADLHAFKRQPQGIASIDVSPDGAWVTAATKAGGVLVWRIADGTLVARLTQDPATDVHFSPAGDRLCASFADLHLVSWKTSDWSLQWNVQAHDMSITRIAYSVDGTQVATASVDGTARLFDAADGTLLHTLPVGSVLLAAAFSPDGQDLATGGADGTIRLWDLAQGTLVRQFAPAGTAIASLRFTGAGTRLLSGGEFPSRLEEWNPADGARTRVLSRLASSVGRVVTSRDASLVAVAATFDQRVDVFRAANGRRLYSWNTGTEASDVAFSPARGLVALPGAGNTVVIRRLSDGAKVHTLVGHAENVVGLAFSHDGKLLASGSYFPGSIRLWRTSDWRQVRVIQGSSALGAFGPFVSFSFSPDDTLLGTVAEAAPLVVRVSDGGVVARPESLSRAAAFSPDGRLYVASGMAGFDEVRIFRTSDWTMAATLATGANDIAFSADGTRLLAAQLDALRMWRTSDWTVAKSYDQELGYAGSGLGVQAVALSPDDAFLAYGRDDATLVVARNPHPVAP